MKINKFNLSQLKGYYNNFTYKVELKGFDEDGDEHIQIRIFNPNNIQIAICDNFYHGKRPFKKYFHRHIKYFVSDINFYIRELIDENYINDDCFTTSKSCISLK